LIKQQENLVYKTNLLFLNINHLKWLHNILLSLTDQIRKYALHFVSQFSKTGLPLTLLYGFTADKFPRTTITDYYPSIIIIFYTYMTFTFFVIHGLRHFNTTHRSISYFKHPFKSGFKTSTDRKRHHWNSQ